MWNLKGIDGNSIKVMDNILHNASRNFQTPNIILKQRNTNFNIKELKQQLKFIFDKNYKKKIKQVMLFDRKNSFIAYFKR